MKLIVMRHGETEYNKQNLLQGRTDTPLNRKGVKEALSNMKK
jgi:Fructose-2,6-bisphosphatase